MASAQECRNSVNALGHLFAVMMASHKSLGIRSMHWDIFLFEKLIVLYNLYWSTQLHAPTNTAFSDRDANIGLKHQASSKSIHIHAED